jgi:M6 family metalloprotease-like protein
VKAHGSKISSAECIVFQHPRARKDEVLRLNKRARATCKEIQIHASWVGTNTSAYLTNSKAKRGEVKVNIIADNQGGANIGTNANKCKITSSGSGWNSVGFPLSARFGGGQDWSPLRSKGTIRALVIGTDFPNYPGQTKPSAYVEEALKTNTQFYETMSYGAVKFDYNVLPRYVRMSKNAEDYGIGAWGRGDYVSYYREALSNAAAEFDIGGYDVAYVMASPQTPTSAITSGPAFPWPESTADGVVPLGAATGAMPLSDRAFRWMAHETGHLFGLVDLYDVSGNVNPGGSRHTRFGWWDIMSMNWETFNLELNGWFRFQLGWIKDSEAICFEVDKVIDQVITIPNLASQSANRLAVLRTGQQKVIVIERRSITQYAPMSGNSGFEGVLVYEVDGATNFQSAPVAIVRKSALSIDDPLSSAALKPGESISISGIEISVSSESATESTVTIRKSN